MRSVLNPENDEFRPDLFQSLADGLQLSRSVTFPMIGCWIQSDTLQLLQLIADPRYVSSGLRNRDVREGLYGETSDASEPGYSSFK